MIVITHHTGEAHGILGAQVAATCFTRNLDTPAIVVGIERVFSKESLLNFLDDYYESRERVIGFSHLCGRKDLIELIGIAKNKGFVTMLGGPQAQVDYYGEAGWETNPIRFAGLHSLVDVAVQGPVDLLKKEDIHSKAGCLNFPWGKDIDLTVDWTNIHTFSDQLRRLDVRTAQVLNAIGCPHATKKSIVRLPPPEPLQGQPLNVDVGCYGCIFCDVARDKGYHGHISRDKVMSQIESLPEEGGIKVPFEIIDEYPINSLGWILEEVQKAGINLSRIDLVCRVDDINVHQEELQKVLDVAKQRRTAIMFASIGFESFNDRILGLLNKGITVDDILRCVRTLRELKAKFGNTLLYKTNEGANHGFIHPTPWDDDQTMWENNRNIAMYRLFDDILPQHSVPLIIHHSSYLGDWIRGIEADLNVAFKRDGTWIEWWTPPERIVL
jgi:hypothetical protein